MYIVFRESAASDIRFFAGPRGILVGVTLLPLRLLFFDWSGAELAKYSLMGLIAAPATVLVWWAVGKLPLLLWSSATLLQAPFAAFFAAFLVGAPLSLASALAMLFILSSIFIEIYRSRGQGPIEKTEPL